MKATILIKKGRELSKTLESFADKESEVVNLNPISLESALARTRKAWKMEERNRFLTIDHRMTRVMQGEREREKTKKTKFREGFREKFGERKKLPKNKNETYNIGVGERIGEKMTENKKREETPFVVALRAARKINTRKPQEEQGEEYGVLIENLKGLDERSKRNLFLRLKNEVLEERAPLEGLFIVAFKTGHSNAVHHVAAIRKAILIGGLKFENMEKARLAEIKTINGRTRTFYREGKNAIEEAIPKLIELGENEAAKILASHLRTSERMSAIARAKREAREAKKSTESASSVDAEKTSTS